MGFSVIETVNAIEEARHNLPPELRGSSVFYNGLPFGAIYRDRKTRDRALEFITSYLQEKGFDISVIVIGGRSNYMPNLDEEAKNLELRKRFGHERDLPDAFNRMVRINQKPYIAVPASAAG